MSKHLHHALHRQLMRQLHNTLKFLLQQQQLATAMAPQHQEHHALRALQLELRQQAVGTRKQK